MKKCSQCKEIKPLEDFYRDRSAYDGLSVRCKPCARSHSSATAKQRRARGVKYPRGIEPKRCNTCGYLCDASMFGTDQSRPDGLNPTCKQCRAIQPKRNSAQILRDYRARHPDRNRARSALGTAIKRGHVPHPTTCICYICSKPAIQYHHHLGYAPEHRYHVIPVCISCHELIDHELLTISIPSLPPVYIPRTLRH